MGNPAEAAHGPGLIGAFLNIFLYGLMSAQVFYYFTTYKKDRLWIKAYVLLLFVADLLNSVFDIFWLYGDIIIHFGDVNNLNNSDWRLATDPAMVATIATIVQLFYAWRVKSITGNVWLSGLIVVTSFVALCGGLGTAIAVVWVKHYTNFSKFDQVGIVWLISTAVCDTAITASLTWFLRTHRTGFTHTDDVLNKIIRLTVSNGFLTAVWAIVDLILFLTIPTGVHLAMNLPLAKLYTNSLMASLNSRSGWKFSSADTDNMRTGPASGGGGGGAANKSNAMPEFVKLSTTHAATRPEVLVTVECHEMIDVDTEDGDADTKWDRDASESASRASGRKVRDMV
ncbi:hypothetical protein PHLGIDRAFT_92432 [Phlebiopsis gigantea 11061_1 CR5-6]|uniref:DUF6534 domain-containing protein n=1 Tax=Phlebiopsis gigantea (strain 11061_1 CR5-6) TaxID=745531 RepID=A0A0C3NJX0_PHLG1|nr:hypothetical protein PHLGIDRAFT_92432 [Phlebiopsis gigantea 11061_1 CR5-6]